MSVTRTVPAALLTIALTLLSGGCAARRAAATAPGAERPASPWRFDAMTSTLPKYLGSNGGIFHEGSVQHTVLIAASTSTGAYGKLFFSLPLGNRGIRPNYGREVDVSLGWNGAAGGVRLNGELTFVDADPLGRYRGNVVQISSIASRELRLSGQHTLTPYSHQKYFFPTAGNNPGRGFFFHEGANHAWSLRSGPDVWNFAELVYDSGVFGFQRAILGRAQTALVWNAEGGRWRVQAPIVQFVTPLTAVTDGRRTRIMTSATVMTSW